MRITVVGGGYVGLVTGACFAELGHTVDIVEIDARKAAAINAGRAPIHERGLDMLLERHAGERLSAGTDYGPVAEADLSFVCVGTPPAADGSADLSMVAAASRSIGEALRDGNGLHTVVVKSTVPPGTTAGLVVPAILEHSGRNEIGFAMNPEFLREGRAVEDFLHPDRIVIGSRDDRSGEAVAAVYRGLSAPVVRCGLTAAEMIKYASNALLATKISFSNEVGNVCKRLGIDVYEVMEGVGMDHRVSPHFLSAGAGFGGSCFPKDVAALVSLAESLGEEPALLRSVLDVNDRQPLRLVGLLEEKIGDLAGKRVAVLGLAFKDNTDDIRESRAIPVIAELLRRGAAVAAYDPLAVPSMRRVFPGIDYAASAADALRGADACLVMTEWPEFSDLNGEFDLMKSRVVIEGRRILSCGGKEGICW
ncbi:MULTISPECIES: UDP-glucose dehydrogenase family protein [Methanoculleus]|uniref:UDP-glucose 6-dehydrogenase n=2 Tax=Methanoculleus TaxID=45989 RepID=A3CRZ1_METMJ|nr:MULTISPECIES: UDP-glucose/GDP-mannose dehydrogenase family protein [Methanoculleus]ABN56141.1 UDP-glucose 6-dehydrogenase [Methanoculleus marisnigri JR1]UYU17612.1 UDP-glucose/GDP-mannose dehydrogenase family protein [Methanoculleus submarinus]